MKGAPQRPIRRVEEPLSALLRRVDPEGRMRVYRVWDFWGEVVGAAIAERARPRQMREGELVVEVSNHAWMQELQFMKEDIRARLNERLGAPLLTDLRFVLGRFRERRAKETPAPVPVAVPELPSTGSTELDDVLRRIATAAARRRAALEPKKKRRPASRKKQGLAPAD